MKRLSLNRPVSAIVRFIWVLLLAPWVEAQQSADIVLHNGKILTVDNNFSTAEAVAITANKFTMVGRNQDVLGQAGSDTLKIDLKGRTVTPGFIGTHLLVNGPGAYEDSATRVKRHHYSVDWRGIRTKQDFLNQIKGLMDKYQPKPGVWLYFEDELDFTVGEAGGTDSVDLVKILYNDTTRWDLDTVIPNNPAIFTMGIPDENGNFLNSMAFDIVWKKHGDFLKKYGRYWLAPNGLPDGHTEAPFSRLVLALYKPRQIPEDMAPGMRKELEELSSVGLTTLAGTLRPGAPSIAAYKLLEQRGELNMRAAYGFGWDSFGVIENVDDGLKQFQKVAGSGSDLLWVNSTGPSSMDGSSTRACTNQKRSEGTFGPIDAWWPVGQCIVDSEFRGGSGRAAPIQGNYFKDWVMAMGRYRLRLANAHVAGDRSSGILLGFVEEIQKRYGPDATKDWAFDHCTMVDPANFQRIARARILYACAAQYIDRLSPEVAKSYGEKVANTFVVPAKSMLAAGVRVVFEARGTGLWRDFEIFETRMDAAGKVWGPQERLDRPTILKMATRTAAEYVLKGDQLGSIEAGKLADLVVLDRDYLTIPVEQVREIQPQMTVTNGRIVFVHPNFSAEYNLRPAGAVISTLKELQSRRKTAGGGE